MGKHVSIEVSMLPEGNQNLDFVPKTLISAKAKPARAMCRREATAGNGIYSTKWQSAPPDVSDYGSDHDNASISSFEFHKGDKGVGRSMLGSYSKPLAPSKWDDADKWLVNCLTSELRGGKSKSKTGMVIPSEGQVVCQSSTEIPKHMQEDDLTHINRWSQEPCSDLITHKLGEQTKMIDTFKHAYAAGDGCACGFLLVPMETKPPPTVTSLECYPPCDDEQEEMKEVTGTQLDPIQRIEKPSLSESFMPGMMDEQQPLSPPLTLRSVSMRDMGTEMTPMASEEPSRTGTPIRSTTPTMHSPVSSQPSTPRIAPSVPVAVYSEFEAIVGTEADAKATDLSEKEKTRKEILALGVQLGKSSIAAWASKEEEDADASKSLKNIELEEVKKNVLETRAVAWEEAEQAKHLARFKREEARIQAWENHEKAKAEAELQRIEVKVEKMRSLAYEKLMSKSAVDRRRAEEQRAVAQAKLHEKAAKTSHRADHIRRTGRIPSSFFSCGFWH